MEPRIGGPGSVSLRSARAGWPGPDRRSRRMESLESRLELLERRCRRLQAVTLAALALGALGVGVALLRPVGASTSGELVASRLTLMDGQGRTRATLSAQ